MKNVELITTHFISKNAASDGWIAKTHDALVEKLYSFELVLVQLPL